ncbi:MAG: hypothetical protein DWI58_14550 [Chloroflexi bacterium]|nr:MAG: hypothetical protein DWI58_14550 [Chloroflexota bacterium]
MTPDEATAVATIQRWLEGFNARDAAVQVDTFNFPHVRLAGGKFRTIEDGDAMRTQNATGTERLRAEGWGYTTLESITPVQSGPGKVHVAVHYARRRSDGTVYTEFDSLWIVTEQDGHWGVQFRSSYLENQ